MSSLPKNETKFMATLSGMPYSKRNGYAIQLAKQYRDSPDLLLLIRQLLSTSPLPRRVPFLSSSEDSDKNEADVQDAFIDLQYPQTTASKKFVQRELGIMMAASLGNKAVPILLEELLHPSTSGKNTVISTCLQYASNDELVDIYPKCVPAVRQTLRSKLQNRPEVRKKLGIQETLKKIAEAELSVLEQKLEECLETQRSKAWDQTSLESIWPHKHLKDTKYLSEDSMEDLIEKLFDLVERYPIPTPTKSDSGVLSPPYDFPSPISCRIVSFLVADMPRALNLIKRFGHAEDPKHEWRDTLRLPSIPPTKKARLFWGHLSLDAQNKYLEPFFSSLLTANNGALLKNGQLKGSSFFPYLRWPVIRSLLQQAIAFLPKAEAKQQSYITTFILEGISNVSKRIQAVALVDKEEKRIDQRAMQEDVSAIIQSLVKNLLASMQATESDDEAVVIRLRSTLIQHILYLDAPFLSKVLFNNIKGIFSMRQVSTNVLRGMAVAVMPHLRPRVPKVSDIPDYGLVQPYNNLPIVDNDEVFEIVLYLAPPKEHFSFWASLSETLSQVQRSRVWAVINDEEFLVKAILQKEPYVAYALSCLAPIADRHAIIRAAMEHPDFPVDLQFSKWYPLIDISDPATRAELHKHTYTRVFGERLVVYSALMKATNASNIVAEFIKTMTFLIPRTKNEKQPDAEVLISSLFPAPKIDLWKSATDEEAREIAALYLAWERQNNEAVSSVQSLRQHLQAVANECLSVFCVVPSGPFFQLGMQLLWVRCLNDQGLANARSNYNIFLKSNVTASTEEEEIYFRKFVATLDKDLGSFGNLRIQQEENFVEAVYRQFETVHGETSFKDSPAYPVFVLRMCQILRPRWERVPRLVEFMNSMINVLETNAGTPDSPADWSKDPLEQAQDFIAAIRSLYPKEIIKEPKWWPSYVRFRELRLLSTLTKAEVESRLTECRIKKGAKSKIDIRKVDDVVKTLLSVHPTAVYFHFVRDHLTDVRQDMLRTEYITTARRGVFHITDDLISPIEPPTWEVKFPRRLYPHQCEAFADMLLKIIHSQDSPMRERVRAAELFTKLPTTTIHELGKLLQEDINPRISEAVLMFMPRLDEPASGIDFLLSPAVLNGELARTAVFGVKRVLNYLIEKNAAIALTSVLPSPGSERFLKVAVFKELARTITQYIYIPEVQTFIRQLWSHKLQQDVRIALLQSIIPMLWSSHEALAWDIIEDALARVELQLDDTLYVLLSVTPAVYDHFRDDVLGRSAGISAVLDEMADIMIPASVCPEYVERVLWPLTCLPAYLDVESLDRKQKTDYNRRKIEIRDNAYGKIFGPFISSTNALSFAERVLPSIQHLLDHHEDGSDNADILLAVFLITAVGHCVARVPEAWRYLVDAIDLFASRSMVCQLEIINLAGDFLFAEPAEVRHKVTQDRMSLLDPLKRYPAVWDAFMVIAYRRRRVLAEKGIFQGSNNVELEVRSLLGELVRLSQLFLLAENEVVAELQLLLSINRGLRKALRAEILDGRHGLADAPWALRMQLETLSATLDAHRKFSSILATFQTHLVNDEPAFYHKYWSRLCTMILTVHSRSLKDTQTNQSTFVFPILVQPILDRGSSNDCDVSALDELSVQMFDCFCFNAPQWVTTRIHRAMQNNGDTLQLASKIAKATVSFVSAVAEQNVAFSACYIAEAIYFGEIASIDLAKVFAARHTTLSYPYFCNADSSGGDIENRSDKGDVQAIQKSYDTWKNVQGGLGRTKSTSGASSVGLEVLIYLYESFPKLAVVHPSLFFSCFSLSLSSPELFHHAETLFNKLVTILGARREGQKGEKWGWVPPASLPLSFARQLLTEVAEDIADVTLDGNFSVGSIQCKVFGIRLLGAWKKNYMAEDKHLSAEQQLYQVVFKEEGSEALTGEFEELMAMALKDENVAVRLAARNV